MKSSSSVLQRVAVCCSVLQWVVLNVPSEMTLEPTLESSWKVRAVCCSVLQCVAVCYIVRQYVAVSFTECPFWHDFRVDSWELSRSYCSVWQCVAMCCNVLQRVATCCSVMQCVAVCCTKCTFLNASRADFWELSRSCCSVLQCVAVCRSVLQYVALNAPSEMTLEPTFESSRQILPARTFLKSQLAAECTMQNDYRANFWEISPEASRRMLQVR